MADRLQQALSDRYRLERELGAGGMATVHLARDLKHNRQVAIKVLRPELAAVIGAERFLAEIETTARLQHPNILPLFDSGEADGFLYYVMPYVEGESLGDRLAREGALPVPETIRILIEITDALAEAHDRSIVHRDVKPANVLLSGRHALVADFGVAKAVTDATGVQKLTSAGVAIGTPRYMAPEQASADPAADHRADIFAVGVLGYEMLTGRNPFAAPTTAATFAALMGSTPEPVERLREGVPASLSGAIARCLEKDPARRWATAKELLGELEALATPATGTFPPARDRTAGRSRLAAGVGVAAVLAGVAWFVVSGRVDPAAAARATTLPEIERLVEVGEFDGAYRLAIAAQEVIPDDPELLRLFTTLSWENSIESEPAGARVLRREYSATDGAWDDLGVTPTRVFTPYGAYVWRLELEGHRPVEVVTGGSGPLTVALDPADRLPPEMVRVPGWTATLDGQPVRLADFLIDRHEVTNREYKAFVEAGGYSRDEYWENPIVVAGRRLSRAEAMGLFTDRTGRPGPATWEIGDYPEGEADHPVGGVSWYEAAAYARFAGKQLPTVHHWRRAFGVGLAAWSIPASNLEAVAPAPAGRHAGIGPYGTRDMAGNVREWCWNDSDGSRLILGGGWNDPDYMALSLSYSQPAWDRSPTNGIRLARYLGDEAALARARAPVRRTAPPDFLATPAPTDEVFEIYRRMYAYDATPLDARIEAADTTRDWIRERISFDAAYGGERMILYLHLPRSAEPPFQGVLYFPGSAAFIQRSIDQWRAIHLDYLIKSGRAVAFPVFRGTFERESDLESPASALTSAFREHSIQWAKDLSRSIDYLETRPDIQADRLAFFGYSWGGRVAPVMLTVEPRFRAAVLYVAGYATDPSHPEVDPVNFARRVSTPVLMLSGRYDAVFPLETHAEPFFRMLGTPAGHKRHVVSDGGHFVPRTQLIRETLDWLDRYLGPVGTRPAPRQD